MRRTIFTIAFLVAATLRAENPDTPGAHFDEKGHFISYVYPDGSRDEYTYDTSWRMIIFTGRDGKRTFYIYHPDGTVEPKPIPGKVRRSKPAEATPQNLG